MALKKIAVIVLVLTILVAAAALIYIKYLKHPALHTRDFIPQSSIAVYESDECQNCSLPLDQSPLWRSLKTISLYGKDLDSIKSLLNASLSLSTQRYVSIHATKKDEFDLVFYGQLKSNSDSIFQIINSRKIKLSHREFNKIRIYEALVGRTPVSFILLDNIWAASLTPFLIEDVVRTAGESKPGFFTLQEGIKSLPPVKADAGNLYIRLDKGFEFYSLFFEKSSSLNYPHLAAFTTLDVRSEKDAIVLNGFTTDTTTSGFLLSALKNQDPIPFTLKAFISNRTALFQTVGISDGEKFFDRLQALRNSHLRNDSLAYLSSKFKIELRKLFKEIRGEIGMATVPTVRSRPAGKIMILTTTDRKRWEADFSSLAETLSEDSVFKEIYSEYTIRQIPMPRLLEKMFYPFAENFRGQYYCIVRNTIMIAENLADLKLWLRDIDEDETWAKSTLHNRFLESTLLESSLSYYFDVSQMENILLPKAKPKWKQFLKANPAVVQQLGLGSLQFSNLNNNFYTNIYLQNKATAIEENKVQIITHLTSRAQKIFSVKSHVNRRDEILVQDSLHNLSLVSTEGNVLWTVQLDTVVTSDISQIDFFGNGKLQYFFTTARKLYVIDRTGKNVEPFPAETFSSTITEATALDYDNTRKYRFLIADASNQLWMYDKEASSLDGWKPRHLSGNVVGKPRHHRIHGKDYIIALTDDASVHLFNRRGESIKGFPVKMASRINGDYFIDVGERPSKSVIIVITDDGFRQEISLSGDVVSREPLIKRSVRSRFRLISGENLSSFVILRSDESHCEILDENGVVVISENAIGNAPVFVKYLDITSSKKYFLITDINQSLTYLYNGNGDQLQPMPVYTDKLLLTRSGQDRVRLCYIQDKSLVIETIED